MPRRSHACSCCSRAATARCLRRARRHRARRAQLVQSPSNRHGQVRIRWDRRRRDGDAAPVHGEHAFGRARAAGVATRRHHAQVGDADVRIVGACGCDGGADGDGGVVVGAQGVAVGEVDEIGGRGFVGVDDGAVEGL